MEVSKKINLFLFWQLDEEEVLTVSKKMYYFGNLVLTTTDIEVVKFDRTLVYHPVAII